jgi:RNA polymerase sigma-70 factor (ECF subfamily)
MTSDDDLVEALRGGDREALATLFERHRDFVFRVALGLTGRRDDAAEIVQETFLALLERSASLDSRRGRVTTWLFEVARRRAVDRRRRRRFEIARSDAPRSPSASAEDAVVAAERRAALHRAVAELPDRPREVFVLRVGLGLSVDETARLLDCGAGAVRTALYEAHGRLRAVLSRWGEGARDVRHLSPSAE